MNNTETALKQSIERKRKQVAEMRLQREDMDRGDFDWCNFGSMIHILEREIEADESLLPVEREQILHSCIKGMDFTTERECIDYINEKF